MMRAFSVLLTAGMIFGGAALADNPGQGKGGKGRAGGAQESGGVSISVQINDSQRSVVREYYGREFARGQCPPGLAKKNNGCMPPGQAKKWARGRPLPRDVVFHELPASLTVRLNAPAGTRYVRVAADVLLIAVGTGMVLDAIEDLSRL